MDLQTCLLCLVLALISGAILLFISIYGMKEKTYEEAIAEQRKMPDEALLLRRPSKDKSQSKKLKRVAKKVKEKSSNNNKVTGTKKNVKSQSVPITNSKENEQSLVDFLTSQTEILNEMSSLCSINDKKIKKDKVKPVLVNNVESAVPPRKDRSKKDVTVNHFTEIIPRDDLQLKSKAAKTNSNVKKSSKEAGGDTKENLTDKSLKVKERGVTAQAPLVEINNKIENEKNVKNELDKDLKSDKIKPDKGRTDKIKDEKIKDVKIKVEKVKEEKIMNNERIKPNEKVSKNEEQKVAQQQQQQQSQKNAPDQKQINGSISAVSNEKGFVQIKKASNQQQQQQQQQQLNTKELKSKKPKNNGIFSLQQMVDKDTININLLISLIQKAELSRSEVQLLTDQLLTKHLDEVTDHFEWIEGRQDPVVKLKKQLAEKEKALAEEQQACQAFQNKLKELRSEYNSERVRLTQACRQYEETVLSKQGEIQNLHATNRHLLDSHVAEKQALTQKIQQLQAQISDENLVIRKLQEDHNQTQNALQQELVNQGQQMEMHIGRLSEQLQEAQKNFEAQIHNKMQEAEQMRASFNAELQKNRRLEEELRDLREQQIQSQSKLKSLESRASQLKETTNHTQELLRQIEELQRANKELEIRYESAHQVEEELKFEKTKLQNEIHGFRNTILELQNECDKLQKSRDKIKAAKNDLENDFLRMKDENQCLISQVSSFTKVEREAQRLREENESLAAQVTAFTERPAADGRENGDSLYAEEIKSVNVNTEFINHESEKQKSVIIERLTDELKQKDVLLEKVKSELEERSSEVSNLSIEIAKYKTDLQKLKDELEAQRNKNNDLRKKNWKAMEALAATEKTLENNQKETEKSFQASLKQHQEAIKKLLERIFPTVKVYENVYEDWLVEFEKSAKNYLEELSEETRNNTKEADLNIVEDLETKNGHLQASIVYYKNVIEDTEGMLKKLQSHIEQEEIRWRQQCETLEHQSAALKEKLAAAEDKNKKLEVKVRNFECDADTNKINEQKWQQISEEMKDLKSKLSDEEAKNRELSHEVVKLKGTVKFGQDAYVEENKRRLELEEEVKVTLLEAADINRFLKA